MFEHSVKVPRHYKIAANIFKKVSTEGGSVKTLLYDDKLKHFRTNVLYALITETIKHAADIDRIFMNCKILEQHPRLDPWLGKILVTELLFGKKELPGKSKPEQTVLSYKEQFDKYMSDHQDDLKTEVTRRPRYVRINTNLLTTSDAIRAFQDEGYRFIRCTSGSYADYLEQIQKLTEEDFTQDYHVKTMFVFASGTKLYEHELYLEKKIVLQDKATAMAVTLLAPPPGSTVLDMCAAPGMKTTQLAAYIKNTGKIYAVERNDKRYELLREFVKSTGSECVETILKDALEIKRGEMDDVEYILLDPSCSGSGMEFSVHSYIDSNRLAKLTSLQEKFLKHAMNAFPKAKRIVYSTCSLLPEENERVITNVVKTSRAKWRVQDVKELLKGQWNNFGSGMYGSMGTRCMYARPETDLTTGFFLAVLDRDPKDIEKAQEYIKRAKGNENGIEENGIKEKREKKKKVEDQNSNINENVEPDVSETIDGTNNTQDTPKKKKKKRHNEADNQLNNVTDKLDDLAVEEAPKKKKKKDKVNTMNQHDSNANTNDESQLSNGANVNSDSVIEESEVPKKKKKKHIKNNVIENDENVSNGNVEINEGESKKEKKRKKDLEENEMQLEEPQTQSEPVIKKKKSKKHEKEISEMTTNVSNTLNDNEVPKKKKKKKCTVD